MYGIPPVLISVSKHLYAHAYALKFKNYQQVSQTHINKQQVNVWQIDFQSKQSKIFIYL